MNDSPETSDLTETTESTPEPQRSIDWGKLLLVAQGSIFIVLLVILVGIWRVGTNFFGAVAAAFDPNVTERVQPPNVIIARLQEASQLTTSIFAMEAVVPARTDLRLGDWTVGRTQLLYIAYGEVRAGVDLSQVSVDRNFGNTIAVTLPPPQLLDSKIDVERSRIYDYERGLLGPDTAPQLLEKAQKEALEEIRTAACRYGILEEANRRAESVVRQLFATAGYEAIEVVTTTVEEKNCNNEQ